MTDRSGKYVLTPLGDRAESIRLSVYNALSGETVSQFESSTENNIKSVEPTMSINCGWEDEIPKGGTIDIEDNENINWESVRISSWYRAKKIDGTWEEKKLGDWVPGTPTGSKEEGSKKRTIEVYDSNLILKDDQITTTFIANPGNKVVSLCSQLIESTGITKYNIQYSEETPRTMQSWPPGTPKLQVIQELLSSINFTPLTMSWDGTLESHSMSGEDDGDPVLILSDDPDEGLGYFSSYEDEQDLFSVPNRWIGTTRSGGVLPGLLAVVENLDPESPTSYQARGNRWVSSTTNEMEATSQEILEEQLKKKLKESENATRTITVTHPFYDIDLRDLVEFKNKEHATWVVGKVTDMSLNLTTPGVTCTTTLRVVRYL